MNELRIDALLPSEMARRAEYVGVGKAEAPKLKTFALSILAGAFISMGAVFATTVATGASEGLTYGVTKLLVGFVFCLGLILVVVGGAELFTGNNLIIMAWANRQISTFSLLRNWGIVYVGNLVGALLTVLLVFAGAQYELGGGEVERVLSMADGVLLLVENSWISSSPLTVVPYANFFVGWDRPQSVARAGVSGGILRNTGINFDTDGRLVEAKQP